MTDCRHIATRGREGETGLWCESCGVKVWDVHDRPCGECAFMRDLSSPSHGYHACTVHCMVVTPCMKVTYPLLPEPKLCFVARGDVV